MKELISIIVPIYNIMDCLEKCVESLRAQTYSNIEIILVDDGSTDGTEALVDKLGERDERIRVFHKENGGSSSARNFGIKESRGSYLGFVDSDDYVEPTMYEKLYAQLQTGSTKIAQIGRDEIDAEGHILPDICTPPKQVEIYSSEVFLKELLLHRGDCSFCTKLIHRELFFPEGKEPRLFPEGVLNEDFHLMVRLLQEHVEIASLPGVGYHVFYRIGSNTRKQSKEEFSRVFVDIVENADRVYELVQKDYPELTEVAIRFGLFQRLDFLLHIPISQMTKENVFYQKVVSYLRMHRRDTAKNPYLTKKNRLYLTLFTICPKTLRKVHRLSMRVRGIL